MTKATFKQFRITNDSIDKLTDILASQDEFNYSNTTIRGRKAGIHRVTVGRLHINVANELLQKNNANMIEYVIYSYNTPIAWLEYSECIRRNSANSGWTHYRWVILNSISRHADKLREAISDIGGVAIDDRSK